VLISLVGGVGGSPGCPPDPGLSSPLPSPGSPPHTPLCPVGRRDPPLSPPRAPRPTPEQEDKVLGSQRDVHSLQLPGLQPSRATHTRLLPDEGTRGVLEQGAFGGEFISVFVDCLYTETVQTVSTNKFHDPTNCGIYTII
jgi:hypothetical protein